MEMNELFNKIVNSGLINEIELKILQHEGKTNEDIIKTLAEHLEAKLMNKNLVCPNCVKEILRLRLGDEEVENTKKDLHNDVIPYMDFVTKSNHFVDNERYLKMLNDNKDIKNMITYELYKSFCWECLMKIKNIKSLSVKKCKDIIDKLLNCLDVKGFYEIIKNVENDLKDYV